MTESQIKWLEERTWIDFDKTGLLWWINRMLHLFGWVIVFEYEDGVIKRVYPARCRFRGFSPGVEENGFKRLSRYVHEVSGELVADTELTDES